MEQEIQKNKVVSKVDLITFLEEKSKLLDNYDQLINELIAKKKAILDELYALAEPIKKEQK
jgi:adenine specific DNA methylase Mod